MRHTLENAEKKRCEMESLAFFVQCSSPAVTFFARKHRKNRCENKTQVQFRVSKVPKLEFQPLPAKKSHHPARQQTHALPSTTMTTSTTTIQSSSSSSYYYYNYYYDYTATITSTSTSTTTTTTAAATTTTTTASSTPTATATATCYLLLATCYLVDGHQHLCEFVS